MRKVDAMHGELPWARGLGQMGKNSVERRTGVKADAFSSEGEVGAEIGARVGAIWARALEQPVVDEHSDFYFDGGNHFLAPVMMQTINEEFGLELTVRHLEQART